MAAVDSGSGPTRRTRLWMWVLALALLLFPLLVTAPFYQRIGALVLLSAITASAWNLLGGYAGQISVGHAVFYGIGAYVPLLFYTHLGTPPLAGVPVGILLSVLVATVMGLPTFRLRGHYFTMATIAVAELVRIVVVNWSFVGGAVGLSGPMVPRSWLDLSFRSSVPYYYMFLAVLAGLLAMTWLLARSRSGFYFRALRSTERGARSLGVPVLRYKLWALLLSAAFTSLAGSLYALMIGFVDPDSVFGILVSVDMVIVAALGGAGTLLGPLIGAMILVPLATEANTMFGGSQTSLTYVIYGGIIMLLCRFEPGGLAEIWHRRRARQQETGRAAARGA